MKRLPSPPISTSLLLRPPPSLRSLLLEPKIFTNFQNYLPNYFFITLQPAAESHFCQFFFSAAVFPHQWPVTSDQWGVRSEEWGLLRRRTTRQLQCDCRLAFLLPATFCKEKLTSLQLLFCCLSSWYLSSWTKKRNCPISRNSFNCLCTSVDKNGKARVGIISTVE